MLRLKPFDYYAPRDLNSLFDLLAEKEAKVFAGGTDLFIKIKDGVISPKVLVDLKRIDELSLLSYESTKGLTIGAINTLNEIAESPIVREKFPLLAECCSKVGSYQIRNKATLVGNVCNASPAADTAPALLIYDAVVNIKSRFGGRSVPITEFFRGPGSTALKDGEIVTSIFIPYIENCKGRYYKLSRIRSVDLATVGIAVAKLGEEYRIALGAVAPTPLRVLDAEEALKGRKITLALLDEVGKIIEKAVSPITDLRGSAEYRREMSVVLVKRLLRELSE
ncbi:MAG: xanthine dehydrogenase family protein subunit M [Synergistetes bacterium]|nr:xanthine dehydrogenase family protein subunit M [Synergistota bacterium]